MRTKIKAGGLAMKTRFTAIMIGIAMIAAGISLASPSASAASRPVVVYGVPYGHLGGNFVHPRVRPIGMLMWTGDGSAWFIIHSWRTWSSAGATGSATVHVRSCWGNCRRYKTEATTLHFYRVLWHDGRRYFSRLHFALAHKVAGLGSSTLMFCARGVPAWYYRC